MAISHGQTRTDTVGAGRGEVVSSQRKVLSNSHPHSEIILILFPGVVDGFSTPQVDAHYTRVTDYLSRQGPQGLESQV